MPAYDYRCEAHGLFEVVSRIAEHTPQRPCPTCAKPADQDFGDTNIAFGLCNTTWGSGNWFNREFARNPSLGKAASAAAARAGISTTGRRFNHALADEPDDPQAWVGSLDEVKEVCKRKGLHYKVEDGEPVITGESHYRKAKRLRQIAQGQAKNAVRQALSEP